MDRAIRAKAPLRLPSRQALPLEATHKEWVSYPSGKAFLVEGVEPLGYGATGNGQEAPLLRIDQEEKLSENFWAGEFFAAGSSGSCLRISPFLIEKLEAIRQQVGGKEIRVHSGYRTSSQNAQVGGVVQSAHVDGLAADISARGVDLTLLYSVADDLIGQSGGVGFYPDLGYIHIDVAGRYSRWAVES